MFSILTTQVHVLREIAMQAQSLHVHLAFLYHPHYRAQYHNKGSNLLLLEHHGYWRTASTNSLRFYFYADNSKYHPYCCDFRCDYDYIHLAFGREDMWHLYPKENKCFAYDWTGNGYTMTRIPDTLMRKWLDLYELIMQTKRVPLDIQKYNLPSAKEDIETFLRRYEER